MPVNGSSLLPKAELIDSSNRQLSRATATPASSSTQMSDRSKHPPDLATQYLLLSEASRSSECSSTNEATIQPIATVTNHFA